jgi:hypothetical protein
MKQLCILSLPFTLFLLLQNAVSAQTPLSNPNPFNPSQTVLIEAEYFTDYGGWVHDSQFMDQMGSPFLLAHGLVTALPNIPITKKKS